jgi:hypothetical protein
MDCTLSNLIDVCASNRASEFDVAQVLHHMGHALFKYVGDNEWMHRIAEGDFKPDAKYEHITKFCSGDVVHVFLQRALHYQQLVKDQPRNNYDVRVKRLLDISVKLRNPKYVHDVLREAKSFFEHGEH